MEHEEMTQLAEEVKFHPVIANRLIRRQVGATVKAARMIQRRVAREAGAGAGAEAPTATTTTSITIAIRVALARALVPPILLFHANTDSESHIQNRLIPSALYCAQYITILNTLLIFEIFGFQILVSSTLVVKCQNLTYYLFSLFVYKQNHCSVFAFCGIATAIQIKSRKLCENLQ